MSTVTIILNAITALLAILKQIPETSSIANEISNLESAALSAMSSAQNALQATAGVVDPNKLQPIDPVV